MEALNQIKAYDPLIDDTEYRALLAAIQAGHLVGDGPIGRRVERVLEKEFGVGHVLLTASCTAALEMAMLALDIGPGDEVIMPSFTFVSTANCVVLRGARPVFADICSDTLNLNPGDVARRITPRTKAIVPVHYAGVACDMEALQELADVHQLQLIEDAAQGVDACYKDRYLGTIGKVGCYSFHATKNIVCGEGGAFLTNDPAVAQRAEVIREKGTNRSAFLRGDIDKYTWVSVGSSYILSDVLAAILESQLAKRAEIKARRQEVWETYWEELHALAEVGLIFLPYVPPDCDPNYHIFFVRTQTTHERQTLITYLRNAGIPASFHYVPLHTSPFGLRFSDGRDLPVTETCASTLLRLPIGTHITAEQARYVARKIKQFYA